MSRLFVCSRGGFTVDIETVAPALDSALEDDQAEALVRCAVLMVMSSLLEGGSWPNDAMQSMTSFMSHMKDEVCATRLM